MNPVLIMLVAIGAVLLWFMCAWLYKPIGSITTRLIDDSKRAMFGSNKTKENKEEKGE